MKIAKIDYALLREKIQKEYGTLKKFSEEVGICTMSLWRKLNGKTDFTSSEILSIAELLGIEINEIPMYFLNQSN